MGQKGKIELLFQTAYEDLSNSEKKVADYILQNIEHIKKLTMAEMATQCSVSQPTIMRTLKAVGYNSFKTLKYDIVEEIAKGETSQKVIHDYPFSDDDHVSDIPRKIALCATSIIQDTLKSISLHSYEEVVKVLLKADQINIFGIENSAAACSDLATKLIYLGFKCNYIADPYLQKISAAAMGPEDVALGISYSGVSKDTVEAISTAKASGAVTIVLTSFKDAPLGANADIVLCSTKEQLFYGNAIFSRMPQIMMIDMIYMGLIVSDYERFTNILKRNGELIESKILTQQMENV